MEVVQPPNSRLLEARTEGPKRKVWARFRDWAGKRFLRAGTRLLGPDKVFVSSVEKAIYEITTLLNSSVAEDIPLFLRKVVENLRQANSATIYLTFNGNLDFNGNLEHYVTIKRNGNGDFVTASYIESIRMDSSNPLVAYTKSAEARLEDRRSGDLFIFNLIPGDFTARVIKSEMQEPDSQQFIIPLIFEDKRLGLLIVRGNDLFLNTDVQLRGQDRRKIRNSADYQRMVKDTATYLASASRCISHIIEKGFDSLTKLLPRSTFERKIGAKVQEYRARGSNFAVILLDIDFFKHVNDTYGHLVGDKVLRLVAKAILESIRSPTGVREGDLAFRYGGEEFVVIPSNCSAESTITIARRIKKAVSDIVLTEKKKDGQNGEIRITCSIGLLDAATAFRYDNLTTGIHDAADHIFHLADYALYHVKKHGRNGIARVEISTDGSFMCKFIEAGPSCSNEIQV